MDKAHDRASDVSAEQGEVLIDGPGGTALSMTPGAALETSNRLLDGAATAHGQQVRQHEKDRQDRH